MCMLEFFSGNPEPLRESEQGMTRRTPPWQSPRRLFLVVSVAAAIGFAFPYLQLLLHESRSAFLRLRSNHCISVSTSWRTDVTAISHFREWKSPVDKQQILAATHELLTPLMLENPAKTNDVTVVRHGWPFRSMYCVHYFDTSTTPGQIISIPAPLDVGFLIWKSKGKAPEIPTGIIWKGAAANALIASVLFTAIYVSTYRTRDYLRRRSNLCPMCAYPRGTTTQCSECGSLHTTLHTD